jgi:hypothetical protein
MPANGCAVQTSPDLSCQTVNGERLTRAGAVPFLGTSVSQPHASAPPQNVSRAKGSGARAWPRGRLDINAITTVPMLTRSSVAKETRVLGAVHNTHARHATATHMQCERGHVEDCTRSLAAHAVHTTARAAKYTRKLYVYVVATRKHEVVSSWPTVVHTAERTHAAGSLDMHTRRVWHRQQRGRAATHRHDLVAG